MKNSPAPASETLFSPNSTIFEASEPDLSISMDRLPTFSTRWAVYETHSPPLSKTVLCLILCLKTRLRIKMPKLGNVNEF